MAENSSNSDSSVDREGMEPYSEGEEIPDVFLESLEALEENSSEFDTELMGAITEVSNFLNKFLGVNNMIFIWLFIKTSFKRFYLIG